MYEEKKSQCHITGTHLKISGIIPVNQTIKCILEPWVVCPVLPHWLSVSTAWFLKLHRQQKKMLPIAQVNKTVEFEPWTVGATMDRQFKHDIALIFDCDKIFHTE